MTTAQPPMHDLAVAREAAAYLRTHRSPRPATRDERIAVFAQVQAAPRGICARCGRPSSRTEAGHRLRYCTFTCQLRHRAELYAQVGDDTCVWCLGKDGGHNGGCLLAICERDGWCCHVCKRPIDLSRDRHDPESLTFDHLVAYSHGGRRSVENLAMAHRRCNEARGCGDPECDGSAHVRNYRR